MAARKQAQIAANEVMLGGTVVALQGALERTLAGHEALREAEIAWNVEQNKDADEQQLSALFQLLIAMFGADHADTINGLTVIEALRTWAAATAAIQAADGALMAEFGVTVGESEAPTDS